MNLQINTPRVATTCKSGAVWIFAFVFGLFSTLSGKAFDEKEVEKEIHRALQEGEVPQTVTDPEIFTLMVVAVIPNPRIEEKTDIAQVRLLKADLTWSNKVDEVNVGKLLNVKKGMLLWVRKEEDDNGNTQSVIVGLEVSPQIIANIEKSRQVREKILEKEKLLEDIESVISPNKKVDNAPPKAPLGEKKKKRGKLQ